MSNVNEGIRIESDKTLSFGNFQSDTKQKIDNFMFAKDIYNLRTYKQVTKLEKNEEFLLETNPGSAINNFFKQNKDQVSFTVEGFANTIITLQLNEDTLYRVSSGKANLGNTKSNSSGKVKFSIDLSNGKPQNVLVEKIT